MQPDPDLEARLARYIDHHVLHGTAPDVAVLCEDRPEVAGELKALAEAYLALSSSLGVTSEAEAAVPAAPQPLPEIEGFRTVERLGRGGMGEVYKLQDLKLDRVVAGKIVRRDRRQLTALREFLAEARTLALFKDRRIVQIHEFRDDRDPPVIIMEFVDGFELGETISSLEYKQRARIIEQVADALGNAHALGIQHRDLKPSNIMLDSALAPKILDFGLSGSRSDRGHMRGTLPYLAPEQLDPSLPIDARTDVYGLGVILYEALCGTTPYNGIDERAVIEAIKCAEPRLPVEIRSDVPEQLQAVALKAMERDPDARYQSAHEMRDDLRRYLEGRPVLARPRAYASALEARVRPHLEHIGEWLRLRLIYPHEASRLRSVYRMLEAREDDWILSSRVLSYSQISLYLGAFFLLAGSLFYFNSYISNTVNGVAKPFVVLALPFIGLNLVARWLYGKERRAVAVAFFLGGVALLPLFLVIVLRENNIWAVAKGSAGQLFTDGYLSNRQIQVTMAAASAWAMALALRTRTTALSTVFTVLLFLTALAVLTDYGLRDWFENLRYDQMAWHIAPLVGIYAASGYLLERRRCPWFARPIYIGAALTLVVALELVAQNGKLFGYLGLSMQGFQMSVKEPSELGNTLMGMTLAGVVMYVAGLVIEPHGSDVMRPAGSLLYALSPFAALKPLGYLCATGEYVRNFDWFYLVLSVGCAVLSHHRQHRSFYIAGLINTGWGLYVIADHQKWMDKPMWAVALVVVGLAVLALGYGLNVRERHERARG